MVGHANYIEQLWDLRDDICLSVRNPKPSKLGDFSSRNSALRSANCEVAFMQSSFKPPCGNTIISWVDSYENS